MIGSYLGARVGSEGPLGNDADEWTEYAGLALPVGIEVGVGLGGQAACCSVGLFASPVDLGLVAQYRIVGDLGAGGYLEPAEIGVQQLFSPSVYLVLGFPSKFPLAIAAGIQYAPGAYPESVRGDSSNGGAGDDESTGGSLAKDAIRIHIMFAIDVALLQF